MIASDIILSLLAALAALGLSWWSVDRIRALAPVDIPNQRSSHSVPTPRGGGLAIALVTVGGMALVASWLRFPPIRSLAGYLTAAIFIAVASLIDDFRPLGAPLRLVVHAAAAAVVVVACGALPGIVFGGGSVRFGSFAIVLTILWIIGLTNAYNFMDGIDGIAAAQAIAAGTGWAILGWRANEPAFFILGLFLAATTVGFLRHNWPPARIFMGDVGSAFLGFSFASMPLLARKIDGRFVVTAVLFVWPFLFDTSFTFVRRLYHGENVLTAHRSHLYQRLNVAGYSHKWISTLYAILAGGCATGAVMLPYVGAATQVMIISAAVAAELGLWRFVLRAEQAHERLQTNQRRTATRLR